MAVPSDLIKDVADMKAQLNSLYIPKHFDNMMKKIGNIEAGVQISQSRMEFCYFVSMFTCLLFAILVFVALYCMWKMNYFQFLVRSNRFGRFQQPRRCFSCYRSWRTNDPHLESVQKGYMSSPELMVDTGAPLPNCVKENSFENESESDF